MKAIIITILLSSNSMAISEDPRSKSDLTNKEIITQKDKKKDIEETVLIEEIDNQPLRDFIIMSLKH